ncbi:MAG: ComF family protein, partial [Alphaproteobacteria bacterium]|nr:ComF family protein [Alphaproteobacteria bacterium]
MQNALRVIYPHQCLSCDEMVEGALALCGPCWRDTPFLGGVQCATCGAGLPGEDDGLDALCDDCLGLPRPWTRGTAVLSYDGNARRMVLALKHGGRLDMVAPAARWIAGAAQRLVTPQTVVVPVPVHWVRLVSRRYNQSALLAQATARA